MYKTFKSDIAANNQLAWANALMTLLKQKSFEKITVEDLSKELGVNRKYYYRYFENKTDVLLLLIDQALMSNVQPRHRASVLETYFSNWLNWKDLLMCLKRDNLGYLLTLRNICWLSKNKIELQGWGTISMEDMDELRINMAAANMSTILSYWMSHGFRQTPAELVQLLTVFIPGLE